MEHEASHTGNCYNRSDVSRESYSVPNVTLEQKLRQQANSGGQLEYPPQREFRQTERQQVRANYYRDEEEAMAAQLHGRNPLSISRAQPTHSHPTSLSQSSQLHHELHPEGRTQEPRRTWGPQMVDTNVGQETSSLNPDLLRRHHSNRGAVLREGTRPKRISGSKSDSGLHDSDSNQNRSRTQRMGSTLRTYSEEDINSGNNQAEGCNMRCSECASRGDDVFYETPNGNFQNSPATSRNNGRQKQTRGDSLCNGREESPTYHSHEMTKYQQERFMNSPTSMRETSSTFRIDNQSLQNETPIHRLNSHNLPSGQMIPTCRENLRREDSLGATPHLSWESQEFHDHQAREVSQGMSNSHHTLSNQETFLYENRQGGKQSQGVRNQHYPLGNQKIPHHKSHREEEFQGRMNSLSSHEVLSSHSTQQRQGLRNHRHSDSGQDGAHHSLRTQDSLSYQNTQIVQQSRGLRNQEVLDHQSHRKENFQERTISSQLAKQSQGVISHQQDFRGSQNAPREEVPREEGEGPHYTNERMQRSLGLSHQQDFQGNQEILREEGQGPNYSNRIVQQSQGLSHQQDFRGNREEGRGPYYSDQIVRQSQGVSHQQDVSGSYEVLKEEGHHSSHQGASNQRHPLGSQEVLDYKENESQGMTNINHLRKNQDLHESRGAANLQGNDLPHYRNSQGEPNFQLSISRGSMDSDTGEGDKNGQPQPTNTSQLCPDAQTDAYQITRLNLPLTGESKAPSDAGYDCMERESESKYTPSPSTTKEHSDTQRHTAQLTMAVQETNMMGEHRSYHNSIPGVEAKKRLQLFCWYKMCRHCYLTRYSSTLKCYVLSVYKKQKPKEIMLHFKILVEDRGIHRIEGKKQEFSSIGALLGYYEQYRFDPALVTIGLNCSEQDYEDAELAWRREEELKKKEEEERILREESKLREEAERQEERKRKQEAEAKRQEVEKRTERQREKAEDGGDEVDTDRNSEEESEDEILQRQQEMRRRGILVQEHRNIPEPHIQPPQGNQPQRPQRGQQHLGNHDPRRNQAPNQGQHPQQNQRAPCTIL